MIEFQEVKVEGDRDVKLYSSLKAHKLSASETGGEDETREEYEIRKKAMNNYKKWKKKNKNMVHVSSMLLPLQVEDKLITDHKGNPVYHQKTKGVTYRKDKEAEHMDVLKHMQHIAEQHEIEEQKDTDETVRKTRGKSAPGIIQQINEANKQKDE